MPATHPLISEQTQAQLLALGASIRTERKRLRLSATVVAEAAGISRVTLHRIEKGEPSVTMGAWANALAALGLRLSAHDSSVTSPSAPAEDLGQWIPVRVRLADYPQLKALAWQVHGTDTLTPAEALDIYERNARHLDTAALSLQEQALLQALRQGLRSFPSGSNGV